MNQFGITEGGIKKTRVQEANSIKVFHLSSLAVSGKYKPCANKQ